MEVSGAGVDNRTNVWYVEVLMVVDLNKRDLLSTNVGVEGSEVRAKMVVRKLKLKFKWKR